MTVSILKKRYFLRFTYITHLFGCCFIKKISQDLSKQNISFKKLIIETTQIFLIIHYIIIPLLIIANYLYKSKQIKQKSISENLKIRLNNLKKYENTQQIQMIKDFKKINQNFNFNNQEENHSMFFAIFFEFIDLCILNKPQILINEKLYTKKLLLSKKT